MLKHAITFAACFITLSFSVASAQTATTTRTVAAKAKSNLPSTVVPKFRTDKPRFAIRHQENLQRIKEGPIDLLFLGDSITDRWSSSTETWNRHFGKWKPANFGVGGDKTENVIWRITNGELDGISPKVIVLMIGTNNTHKDSPADIVAGIKTILKIVDEKLPETQVLIHGIFPRGPHVRNGAPYTKPVDTIKIVNRELPKLAREGKVRYLDISEHFLVDGKVPRDVMPDRLHLNDKGYQIWAEAITPVLEEMMK